MLRKIAVQDTTALWRINRESLGYEVPLIVTESQIKKLSQDESHHFFLVYEDETTHEAVGYVHGEVYESLYSPTLFNVLALAVAQAYQHRGIGKQLMQGLESEARKREYAGIRLNSGGTRVAAHQFYESIGYRSDKLQKRFLKELSY